MAKPRFYGNTTKHIPNKRHDLRFIKKNQRAREKAPRTQVAGREVKEKEVPADVHGSI